MVYHPTLTESFQVSKVITNFEGGQVITYQACKIIDNGLLFLYGCDTFAEAKNWIEAGRNNDE